MAEILGAMTEDEKQQDGRRKWSKRTIHKLVEEWKSSGQSKKSFSQGQGISYHTFVDWTSERGSKRLGKDKLKDKPKQTSPGFIAVNVPVTSPAGGVVVEVIYPDGRKINFYTLPQGELLKSLLS